MYKIVVHCPLLPLTIISTCITLLNFLIGGLISLSSSMFTDFQPFLHCGIKLNALSWTFAVFKPCLLWDQVCILVMRSAVVVYYIYGGAGNGNVGRGIISSIRLMKII